MKIATLTLNPAVDRTMYCAAAEIGELNRAVAPSMMIHGGKGTNVSCALKQFGANSTAYGFVGGEMGELYIKLLEPYGINTDFTHTQSESRLNFKIMSEDGQATEFNEAGGEITPEERTALLEKIKGALDGTDLFIMGGSVPPGAGKDIYAEIISLGGGKTKFIADCDGEALRLCMAGEKKPHMIKPNRFELEQYTGKKFGLDNDFGAGLEEVKKEAKKIYEETSVVVLCTLGKYGGLYCGGDGVYYIAAPKIEARSFSAAGDTFLAAFLSVYFVDGGAERALAFAVAASAAKVAKPQGGFASLDEAMDMLDCL